ncbi:MAG: hypothetical protein AB8B99_08270 [Phormidesmis sp.]
MFLQKAMCGKWVGFGLTLSALFVMSAIAPPLAKAATYTFNATNLDAEQGGNNAAGRHETISTSFDDERNLFTWSSSFSRNPDNGRLADGGWLVVNHGPDPRAQSGEYVIFYLDGNQGQVSAYDYSNIHRSNSWGSTTFLGSTALETSNEGEARTFSFSLDMSHINSRTDLGPEWTGTAFADTIGIWFHGLDGLSTEYLPSGALSALSYSAQSWYDANFKATLLASATANPDAQTVPEPSAVVALGGWAIALLGMGSLKRQ